MADEPTLSEIIMSILNQLEAPISRDELIRQVLEIRPSKAKNPAASIKNVLKYDHGEMAVIDEGMVIPLHLVMKDIRFRIVLTEGEAKQRAIMLVPWFFPFSFSRYYQPGKTSPPHLVNESGADIPFTLKTIHEVIEDKLFGKEEIEIALWDISDWLAPYKPKARDSLLVTIKDWKEKVFALTFERQAKVDREAIRQQDKKMADIIHDLLYNSRDERIFSSELIPQVYVRLGDAARAYPGHHWVQVVEIDPRLGHLGYQQIGLARYTDLGFDVAAPTVTTDSTAHKKVYRFKAAFASSKSIWRRFELQGSDTLQVFDGWMRDAFNHDTWDHLSEFRIKPKDRRHADWEGFGYHSPMGDGDGEHIKIAEMGLEAGDELQYIYDFGDWIKHIIKLEAITDPEPGVEYPRLVGQNKPKYKYCEACEKKGIKTTATWVCIWCSNDQQRDVLMCEKCMQKEHADHYVDEIVY